MSFVLSLILLIVRFVYGLYNEIGADGEFHLNLAGMLLTVGVIFFFILAACFGILELYKELDDRQ